MQSIYDNQIKAYEKMDDVYEYRTEANYRKHTDRWNILEGNGCGGVEGAVKNFLTNLIKYVKIGSTTDERSDETCIRQHIEERLTAHGLITPGTD